METIKAYVENVFRTLPANAEMTRTKEEILNNMLEKYNELKANGKSEHEAVGIVISEFGNIDELLEEMNLITPNGQPVENGEAEEKVPFMSFQEVKDYLAAYAKSSRFIGLGVFLCIIGVSILIFLDQLVTDNIFTSSLIVDGDDIFGVIVFFILIGIAVALFILNGMRLAKYEFVSKGVTFDRETRSYLNEQKASLHPSFTRNLIIGVCMCVISPIIIVVGYLFVGDSNSYPVVCFLVFVAVAVYILVSSGVRYGCITTLLTEANKSKQQRKEDSLTGSFCGAIMLIATAIFLFFGFTEGQWQYAAPIYAIGGVLCGVVAVIINGISEAKKK